jgi:hypothetical protein
MEAFYIIRAILCSKINVSRIMIRDNQSYCGILLDDDNRTPYVECTSIPKTNRFLSLILAKKKE